MNKELEKKIFDYYLNYYKNICSLKNPEKRAVFRLKEEENEKKRLSRLEDLNLPLANLKHFIVGAGTGGLAVALKEKYNCQISGLEPDEKALEIIKEKCSALNLSPENFKREYCEKISSPDNSFDIIHCYTVLEHVKDIDKSLDEMIRIVKPGGKIYINTPNYSFPYEGHYKIPFPTFLPKIFGYFYLLLLGKSPNFLKTINFITEKKLDAILEKKDNISFIRIKEIPSKSSGKLGWLFNFLKFKIGVNPNQEIVITKLIPRLSILIVNYNSSSFIANSLFLLKKLTKNPYQIFILDNNSKINDWQNLKKITAQKPYVFIERKETNLTGSMAHGTALNCLVEKVNTPYFSVLDADAIWLKKNWDEILLKEINEKIKVIGTQADSASKPQDFPLIYAAFFETETFKKLNIDFRPKDLEKHEDTGCELREKYLSAGFKGKVLEMKNTRFYKNGPFHNLLGVGEYYLNNDFSFPFASHFGRGSTLGAAKFYKSPFSFFYRIPIFGPRLLRLKGMFERKKWISICQKIINF
ncbi:MAG: methyltransferase domain-containing protein [Candidatus Paceibacterota bacterium]